MKYCKSKWRCYDGNDRLCETIDMSTNVRDCRRDKKRIESTWTCESQDYLFF